VNFIFQSPYHLLGFVLALTGLITNLIAFWVLKNVRKNHQIEGEIIQKKRSALKIQENYRAQFNDINAIRQKFKSIKVRYRQDLVRHCQPVASRSLHIADCVRMVLN